MLKLFLRGIFCLALVACIACTARQQRNDVDTVSSPQMDSLSLKAISAYDAGEILDSMDIYAELEKEDPSNSVYKNNMGVLLFQSGRFDEALKKFESASILAPENVIYLVNSGFAKIRLGEQDDALVFFDRALQLTPSAQQAFYGKGVVYLLMDEPEIALGFFRQARKLAPNHSESTFMEAYALQKNGLWGDALKGFTAYIQIASNREQIANAYSNRGLCYFELRDFKRGMSDLNRAIELNDANAIYFYNRAQGYQMRHQFELAADDYTRAISRKSVFPEAYINRAEMNYLLGKEAKACSDLKRACDLGVCEPWDKYESAGKCGK